MNSEINFEEVNRAVLSQSESLVSQWLPNGKREGREWKVGSLHGEPGNSLSINLDTGVWKDFATGEGGGDLISLFAAIRDISQVGAAREISGQSGSGLKIDRINARTARRTERKVAAFSLSDSDREKIYTARLAFSDAFHAQEPIIDEIIASLGLPREALRLAAWGKSGLGLAQGWLCYAYPDGLKWRNPDPLAKQRFVWLTGKATAPWRMDWVKPETRTIYLTEGESDALALIASGVESDGSAVCVASPGTSFPQQWAVLFRGKSVVICFDMDLPGKAAARKVADVLHGYASEIRIWKGANRQ